MTLGAGIGEASIGDIRRVRVRDIFETVAGQALLLLSLIVAIFGAKAALGLPDYIVPDAGSVFTFVRTSFGFVLAESLRTYGLALAAFGVGAVLAFLSAAALSRFPAMASLGLAWALAWQTFPIVALAPLYYVFFGAGYLSALLIAMTISYFPLFLCVLTALARPIPDVERFFSQTGRWPRGGSARVRLNCSYPALEAALLGSAALALVGAVVAEFLFFDHGVGYQIRVARDHSLNAQLVGCLVIMAIVNMGYFPGVKWAFRRMFWARMTGG
jgi:ABC-type nitrate/sulfonate/bicarbonate transport system permease component